MVIRGSRGRKAEALTMIDVGTWLYTLIFGEQVGTDAFGNRYYRNRRQTRYGRERRWVVFKGRVEASKVPPEWHAWLHHMTDQPLTNAKVRPWQRQHLPNLTGTPHAYRPQGHDLRGGKRAPATSDYEPWTPG
jgi:NADH:ubiquinone oxidoreductase subunit